MELDDALQRMKDETSVLSGSTTVSRMQRGEYREGDIDRIWAAREVHQGRVNAARRAARSDDARARRYADCLNAPRVTIAFGQRA